VRHRLHYVIPLTMTLCACTWAHSQSVHGRQGTAAKHLEARPSTVAVGKLKAITKKMTIGEIFRRIGPGTQDMKSGIYLWKWRSSDGRMFYVGASDPRPQAKPAYASFGQRMPQAKAKRKQRV
jgi:hypothetical protein